MVGVRNAVLVTVKPLIPNYAKAILGPYAFGIEPPSDTEYKRMENIKFNYVIGHFWDETTDQIGCYTFGNEVKFGTMEDAHNFLNYVKRKSPDRAWCIFRVDVDKDLAL